MLLFSGVAGYSGFKALVFYGVAGPCGFKFGGFVRFSGLRFWGVLWFSDSKVR